MLAVGVSNVIFSFVSGALLLFLGAYGRFTGGLPADNPYQQERDGDADDPVPLPTIFSDVADVRAAGELAEAERAAARHGATPEQAAHLVGIGEVRRTEDRVSGWRDTTHPRT